MAFKQFTYYIMTSLVIFHKINIQAFHLDERSLFFSMYQEMLHMRRGKKLGAQLVIGNLAG